MVTAFNALTYISGVLYYLSTSINPFLYHIMSNKFREAFKATFKGCFGTKRRPAGSRCYSTLSGKSSQINSHSNTDSCSRQSSLRYLEAEMAKLQDSKRPLVVSFRRKKSQYPKNKKHVMTLDVELQEALDNLEKEPTRREDIFKKIRPCNTADKYELPTYQTSDNLHKCSFADVHNLEPAHICPMNSSVKCTKLLAITQTEPKLEDIEIFHQQRLRLKRKRDKLNKHGNLVKSRVTWGKDVNQILTKSCTMPHMGIGQPRIEQTVETSKENNAERFFTSNWQSNDDVRDNDDERSNSCFHLETVNNASCRANDNNAFLIA